VYVFACEHLRLRVLCASVISTLLLLLCLYYISQCVFPGAERACVVEVSEVSDSLQMFQPQLSDDCSPLPQLTGSQIVFVVFTVAAAQFDLKLRKDGAGGLLTEKRACACLCVSVCVCVCVCNNQIP